MVKHLFALYFVTTSLAAGELTISVTDSDGTSVESVAITLSPIGAETTPEQTLQPTAQMKQIDQQFKPYVLVVPTGSQVTFPNVDSIKHHVYSFSEAKTFELELYDEFTGTPVTFDDPGIVELGCNIHDWMLAYIYVTDAAFYKVTDTQGEALIDLPDGQYNLEIWHPNFDDREWSTTRKINVTGATTLKWTLDYALADEHDFSSGFSDY